MELPEWFIEWLAVLEFDRKVELAQTISQTANADIVAQISSALDQE